MKILVAGSRSIDHRTLEATAYQMVMSAYSPDEWITGCCPQGPDQLPFYWRTLYKRGLPILEFPADWDKYGKGAGLIRNAAMAKVCDGALIIWDGISKGTNHMLDKLEEEGKPYILWKL